jgi:hypothetical protein
MSIKRAPGVVCRVVLNGRSIASVSIKSIVTLRELDIADGVRWWGIQEDHTWYKERCLIPISGPESLNAIENENEKEVTA